MARDRRKAPPPHTCCAEDLNQRLDVVEFQECLRFLGLDVPDAASAKVFKRVAAAGAKEEKKAEGKGSKKKRKKKSKKEREREKRKTKEEKEKEKLLGATLNLRQFKVRRCDAARGRPPSHKPRPHPPSPGAARVGGVHGRGR